MEARSSCYGSSSHQLMPAEAGEDAGTRQIERWSTSGHRCCSGPRTFGNALLLAATDTATLAVTEAPAGTCSPGVFTPGTLSPEIEEPALALAAAAIDAAGLDAAGSSDDSSSASSCYCSASASSSFSNLSSSSLLLGGGARDDEEPDSSNEPALAGLTILAARQHGERCPRHGHRQAPQQAGLLLLPDAPAAAAAAAGDTGSAGDWSDQFAATKTKLPQLAAAGGGGGSDGGKQPLSGNAAQQQKQQLSAWLEVVTFALPMLATLAADPLAALVDTAFVGHLGAAQLAGVGMAVNIFSSITRLFNAPLLAVTTSTVAAAAASGSASDEAEAPTEETPADSDKTGHPTANGSEQLVAAVNVVDVDDAVIDIPGETAPAAARAHDQGLKQPLLRRTGSTDSATGGSNSSDRAATSRTRGNSKLSAAVSSALVLALAFSLLEVCVLVPGADSLVSLWGADEGSPLRTPTRQFLLLRALAAPVTVLLLVTQGVFRGLQDATTPLLATLACSTLNIALEPPFIFRPLQLGVRGSAAATALAQSVPLVVLLLVLRRRCSLRVTGLDWGHLAAMFAPTGFLLLRTVSISAVFAVATSLVARAGPTAAAAHQVAFQIWMAASLLADSLAVASQTIIARATAARQQPYARRVVASAVLMALGLGCCLAAALGAASRQLPGLFSSDPQVLAMAAELMPVVAVTQPLNALAFVLDGVLYGAGGFRFASGVMLLCAAPALGVMFMGQVLHRPQQQEEQQQLLLQHGGWEANGLLPSGTGSFNSSSSDVGRLLGQLVLVQQPSLQSYSSSICLPSGLFGPGSSSFNSTLDHSHSPSNLLLARAAFAARTPGGDGDVGAEGGAGPQQLVPSAVWWVWGGMTVLMFMRAATILLPLACRCYPFQPLFSDLRQKKQQAPHTPDTAPGSASLDGNTGALSTRWPSSCQLADQQQRFWAWRGVRGSFLLLQTAAARLSSISGSRRKDSRGGGGGSQQEQRQALLPADSTASCDARKESPFAALAREQFAGAAAVQGVTEAAGAPQDVESGVAAAAVGSATGSGAAGSEDLLLLVCSCDAADETGNQLRQQQ